MAYRPGEPTKGRWLIPLAAFGMVAATLLLPEALTSMSAMVGALLAAVMIVIGYRVKLRRFYAVGIIALVSGIVLAGSNVKEMVAVSFTFAIAGLALLLSGALGFTRYLHDHPRPHDELS